jgi:L-histidine N-alpha-methyltransferase
MWLRARRDVHAHFDALDRDWEMRAGEEMLTEVSRKFRLPQLQSELRAHGLDPVRAWTDGANDFSLTLVHAR